MPTKTTLKAGVLKVRRLAKIQEPRDSETLSGIDLFGVEGVRSALGIRPDLPEPNRLLVDEDHSLYASLPVLLFKRGRYSIAWTEKAGEEPAGLVGAIIGWYREGSAPRPGKAP